MEVKKTLIVVSPPVKDPAVVISSLFAALTPTMVNPTFALLLVWVKLSVADERPVDDDASA